MPHPTSKRTIAVLLTLTAGLILSTAWWRPRQATRADRGDPIRTGPSPSVTATNPSPNAATPAEACGPQNASPSFADQVARVRRQAEALTQARAFTDWMEAWQRADPAEKNPLAEEGVQRAVARRAAMKDLMQLDPKRALELAVPVGLRHQLPPAVVAELEQRVDDRGTLEVSVWHRGAEAQYDRIARLDGRDYRAFVFGRRTSQATKAGLPLHGIAIDDVMAVSDVPYRELDDVEKAGRGLAFDELAVLVGRELSLPAHASDLAALEADLVAAESRPGPTVADAFSGAFPGIVPNVAAITSPSSWINGSKRVLYLKIDFSDDSGAAFTDAEIQAGAADTKAYFDANSQGKTTLVASILPTTLRMPKPKTYYETSGSTNNELYTAARDAAKAYDAANGNAGTWDPDKFDRYIIVHKRISVYLYGGVAQLGGARVGLNNTVGASTAGHELGHTQSLAHSHFWLPSGNSPVGAGSHVEYGDVFDIMGGGGSAQHLNVGQKAKLGYLDAAAITKVTQAGTYRIMRHDDAAAAGVRALQISPTGMNYDYWIEHRRTAPSSFNAAQQDRLKNGIIIHWGPEKSPSYTTGQGTYLLDATPGTAGGANDAPLRIGETFVDPDAGLTLKPLATGGTAPNEYIDVQVSFGAANGNHDPTLVAGIPSGTLSARSNLIFRATATDPDNDPVYFRWDFGDGQLQPNLGSITRRFLKGGDYTLRVSAHDGRGGIAVQTIPLRVDDPLVSWTRRAEATQPAAAQLLYDVVYARNQFVAVGINQTVLTSPDGATWTRRTFPSGNSLTGVTHNGARFVASGYRFSNATQKGLAAYSDDAVTWTTVPIDSGTAQFWGIASGAGRMVVVGDNGTIYHSADAKVWTAAASGVTTTLRSVAFADGTFVAVGDSGRVLTSPDGQLWTNRSLPVANSFTGVARHNGEWVVRSGSVVYSSADAVSWRRVTTSGASNTSTFRMLSVGGVLLSGQTEATLQFAEMPSNWDGVQTEKTTNAVRALAASASTVVAVGPNGFIYTTSVPSSGSALLPAPTLKMEADAIKLAVGRKNVIAAAGTGFTKLELYVNGAKVSEIDGTAGPLPWTPPTAGNYLLSVRGIDAAGASVVSASYPAVAAFSNWRWLNPKPVGANLRSAVRVDDRWWIVGGGGNLVTLDDSGNFTPIDFPTTQALNAIAYANGRFVIATTDIDGGTKEDIGGLWTSPDGYTWTPFLTGALDSANLNTAIFAADRWIALGTGGTIVSSTDGVNWPRVSSGISTSINGVAAGGGLIVAVAAGGKIITSTDGLTWTERVSGVTTDLRAVAYSGGTFVAAGFSGVILTSTDGATWKRSDSGVTANLYAVAPVQQSFVVGGDAGTLLASADGLKWSPVSLNGFATGTLGLAANGSDALLVGASGDVYTAIDATTWRRRTAGTTESIQGLVFANDRFVAVGSSTDPVTKATLVPIQVSADGVTWKRANANPGFSSLAAVAYGQSRFVAVGPASAVFTSPDGSTWTKGTVNATAAFSCVAAGPSVFVAGSTGNALYASADGTTWTQRTNAFGAAVRAVAYGNGRFVAVGDGGRIQQSSDGTTWTAATSGVTNNLLAVNWWSDVGFIVTGGAGTILTSLDGTSWKPLESGVAENLGAVQRTPFGFVAAGGTQGTMLISLDGISWSVTALPADKTIRGLAYGNAMLVAVGDGGAVLAFDTGTSTPAPVITSQPLSRVAAIGDAVRFSITAQDAAGAVYQWLKNGAPIPGANSPVYALSAVTSRDTGDYAVTVTTAAGSTRSSTARFEVATASNQSRLVNLSINTSINAGGSFTMGYVVGGEGTSGGKPLVIRAIGPSLAAFGVPGTLPDPKIELFSGATPSGTNDNWGGGDALTAAVAAVGAFPFSSKTSLDAAAAADIRSRDNSVKVSGVGAASGVVLAEIYDATPAASYTSATPRLINVSVNKAIAAGEILIAGFVIEGVSARTVLLRAVGPGLAAFGVPGTMPDPKLALFSGSRQIGENDNWGGASSISAASTQVGAFGLSATSKDAVLLTTLQPGAYTAQVSGSDGAGGIVLVEVYEVP